MTKDDDHRRRGEADAQAIDVLDGQPGPVDHPPEAIRELQARGLADPDLDPLLAASALSAMVGRMAYSTYVIGEKWALDDLVATLTRLWANALRIPFDAPAAKPKARAPRARAQTKAKA